MDNDHKCFFDFSDLYSEDFEFKSLSEANEGKIKHTVQKENDPKSHSCHSQESTIFEKVSSSKSNCNSNTLQNISELKQKIIEMKSDTSANDDLCERELNSNEMLKKGTSSEYKSAVLNQTQKADDEFWLFLKSDNKTTSAKKTIENIEKEDEFWDFLKPEFVPYASTRNSTEYIEREDEFWDFLNPQNPTHVNFDHQSLSEAELEEIRSLSTITPFSEIESGYSSISNLKEIKISNTIMTETDGNPQNDFSSKDICKDLDLLLDEINAAVEEIKKQSGQGQQSVANKGHTSVMSTGNKKHLKTNVETYPFKSTAKFENNESKIKKQNIPTRRTDAFHTAAHLKIPIAQTNHIIKPQSRNCFERSSGNAGHCVEQNDINLAKQVGSSTNSVNTHNPCKNLEENISKNNCVKIITSGSNITPYAINDLKSIGPKVNPKNSRLILQNSQVILPELGYKENASNVQLPVISSVFSLSSNLLNISEFSLADHNAIQPNQFIINTLKGNSALEDSNKNLIALQNKIPPFISNSSQLNITCSSTKRTDISPRKEKTLKRLLPCSSPKSSVFKITDSYTNNNIQRDAENAENNKRQKTTLESTNSLNGKVSETSAGDYQNYPPQFPAKMLITNTNNGPSVNSVPIYWALPKSFEPVQTKNVEIVLNGCNQNTNSSNFKTATSLINYTIPVTFVASVPSVASTDVSYSGNMTAGQTCQTTSLPTINVINVATNAALDTSNHLNPITLSDPTLKSVTINNVKPHIPINSANEIIIPTSLSQNQLQKNAVNICNFPIMSTNVSDRSASQINAPHISLLPSNLQFSNVNLEMNEPISGGINGYLTINTLQQKPSVMPSVPVASVPAVHIQQNIRPQKLKPIKSIPLGKDKNAIQQIRVPVKVADLKNSKMSTLNNHTVISTNPLGSSMLKLTGTVPVPTVPVTQLSLPPGTQKPNKTFDFVPYKPNQDSVLVKRNILTNQTEVMSKDKFFSLQPTKSQNLSIIHPENNTNSSTVNMIQGQRPRECNLADGSVSKIWTGNAIKIKPDTIATGSLDVSSRSQTAGTQKSALATLQKLFPPPISTIPVCVMQTVQTANKPAISKVVVLQNPNNSESIFNKMKNQRKSLNKKTETVKVKKIGRKTVRELLEERNQHSTSSETLQSQMVTKVLRPIYKLTENGVLLPTNLPIASNKFPVFTYSVPTSETQKETNNSHKLNKRPNIMILPSAAKIIQSNVSPEEDSNKNYHQNAQTTAVCNSENFKIPSDFLFDKTVVSKDHRPRYYDMCELRIGYFKVDDDYDSCDRLRSKFKVLFNKNLFVYDFPVMKCNQADLSQHYSWEQIAHIQVPFETVVALNMKNRHIVIEVNKCPQVCLKKVQERYRYVSRFKGQNSTTDDNTIWRDSMQNSPIHKITLKKRQADTLKTHLCQFDAKFHVLFGVGSTTEKSILHVSPFEEEVLSVDLKKVFQKNKKNVIRRLPQWDSESVMETFELMNSDHLVSSNHVCSCRISCRSLRCSCVKAAKSCSTGGAACFCMNCENPLNILESYGLNSELLLRDCCLFQNIYQISKLHNFLQRDVKLRCCNSVARVLDCIPGTILCPNTECNASLEFSWCGGIICYPERNPRNHCSFCGQCCFSNGRHCMICNKCYSTTPKCPDCPHCKGLGFAAATISQNFDEFSALPFEPPLPKSCSKPEIILLDSLFSTNCANEKSYDAESSEQDDAKPIQKCDMQNVQEKIGFKDECKLPSLTEIGSDNCEDIKSESCTNVEETDDAQEIIEWIQNELNREKCEDPSESDIQVQFEENLHTSTS